MAVELAPRPEYGLVEPLVTVVEGGVVARGGADVVVLSCPAALDVADATASGRLRLAAGDRVLLGLQHRTTSEPWPAPLPADELDDALRTTADAWRAWSRLHQNYRGPWRDLVHHSGRVLQALSYQPTGAVVAAATTSLPEQVGGERNWDYRYAWVRDASFTLEALWVAACPDEAHQFFDYLAGQLRQARSWADATCRSCSASAASTTSPSERCRTWPGGAGADPSGSATAPGTSARSTSTASCSARRTGSSPSSTRTIRRRPPGGVPHRLRRHRRAPVAGEGPGDLGGARRAAALPVLQAHVLGRARPGHRTRRARCAPTDRVPAWRAAAEEIRAAILTEGWNDTAKSFTQSFGSPTSTRPT